MVFERYVKKEGKLYDPYLYENKKINGETVSTYLGKGGVKNKKFRNVFIFSFLFLLIVSCFGFFTIHNLTGSVISLDKTSFEENGILSFVLSDNFIPASSTVVIESNGDSYRYLLSELVDESPVEGNFIVGNVSGNGLGYGVDNVIFFTLQILKNGIDETTEVNNSEDEDIIEVPEENNSIVENISENEIIVNNTENVEVNVNISEGGSILEEPNAIENPEENIDEVNVVENPVENSDNLIGENKDVSEESVRETIEETKTEEVIEKPIENEEPTEVQNSKEQISITGNVVKALYFLTGKATLDLSKEIEGSCSKGKDFIYDLGDDESATITNVRTNEETLPESSVKLNIEDRKAIVSTDYVGEKVLSLNLTKLNLVGDFKVSLVYNNETFFSEDVENSVPVLNSSDNLSIETVQFQAVANEPVKWKKTVRLNGSDGAVIKLPKKAENIVSYKIPEAPADMMFNAQSTDKKGVELGVEEKADEVEVLVNESALYEIEYETPGPKTFESNISNGKIVVVSDENEFGYQNILVSSYLQTERPANSIKLYHLVDGIKVESNVTKFDTNSNGLIDYVEWVVPHLSNQTYIIEIVGAEHLDSERNFISNIYNETSSLDGVWSETINDGEYVRVVFERELTSNNDITVYPRIVSGNPVLEVYEADGDELVAEFNPINNNEKNKVYLTGLEESQSSFDLKVVGGSLEFDYIVDPPVSVVFVSPTPANGANQTATNVLINATINISNLDEIIFNWNGTNYSLYDDSLVLMLNFDNVSSLGENDTYVVDASKYGNDGVWIGDFDSDSGVTSNGRYGGGFMFDGIDDTSDNYIDFANGPLNQNVPEGVSSYVWIKRNDLGKEEVIHEREYSNFDMYIASGSNLVYCMLRNSSGSTMTVAGSTIDVDIWYNIVCSYNYTDSNLRVYINGIEINNQTVNFDYFSGGDSVSFSVGSRPIGGANGFNGTIDEVRVWNKTISNEYIQQLYFSNLNKYDTDKWMLYVNQSLNSSIGLSVGNYSYFVYAGNESNNDLEQRAISIQSIPPVQNISIYSSIEGTSANVNETIWFYANYTEDGSLITGATCNISFNDSTSYLMNEDNNVYNYSRNFSTVGTYIWNVTCNKTGYTTLNSNSSVLIGPYDPFEKNLILWMEFEDDTNDGKITDSSNSGYVGNCSGTCSNLSSDAKQGDYSYNLSRGEYFSLGNTTNTPFEMQEMTIGFWLNVIDGAGEDYILSLCGTTIDEIAGYTIGYSEEEERIFFSNAHDASTQRVVRTRTKEKIYEGQWYHITAKWDGENVSTYVNGKLGYLDATSNLDSNSESPINYTCVNRELVIGTTSSKDSSKNSNILIDDLRIYNTSLNDSDILRLAQGEIKYTNFGENHLCPLQYGVCSGSNQTFTTEWEICNSSFYLDYSSNYEADKELDCSDGLDNDCDGFTDRDDSDCRYFEMSRTEGVYPLAVFFDAKNNFSWNDEIEQYQFLWDFGDGSNDTGYLAAHVFDSIGNYSVNLTIKNSSAVLFNDSRSINVINFTGRSLCVSFENNFTECPSGDSGDHFINVTNAWGNLTTNTSLLLHSGEIFNFTQDYTKSDGVVDGPVIIGAYGEGERPMINANNETPFQLYGTNDLKVKDIEIVNSGLILGVYCLVSSANCRDNLFYNIKINNTDSSGGVLIWPSRNGFFMFNSEFYNINSLTLSYSEKSMNIAVINNTLNEATGERFLRIQGSENIIISDNNFTDTLELDDGSPWDLVTIRGNGYNTRYVLVSNNIFERFKWFIGFQAQNGNSYGPGRYAIFEQNYFKIRSNESNYNTAGLITGGYDIIIRNNIFDNILNAVLVGQNMVYSGTPSNIKIYNNVQYVENDSIFAYSYTSFVNMSLYNNIVYPTYGDNRLLSVGTPVSLDTFYSDYNVINLSGSQIIASNGTDSFGISEWLSLGFDNHSIFSNPQFVSNDSSSSDFFKINSSSPAYNAGVNLSEVFDDYDGVSRPQGSGYDIGAFEYVASNVSDSTTPQISVVSPTNTTYTNESINFTISSNENLSVCLFSFDSFTINYSMSVNSSLTGANYTNSSMTDGGYTASFWCNDTSGNINNSQSVVFGIDTTYPLISSIAPVIGFNSSSSAVVINYTLVESNPNRCWWTNNSGIYNNSITCGTNITGINFAQGSNTVTVYVNDSAGNKNFTTFIFNVDSILPVLQFTYPANNSRFNSKALTLNVSISESNPNVCIWSNNSFSTNQTITCRNNISAVWEEGTNVIDFWMNDTFGNENRTSVSFSVDTIFPNVTINTPLNQTYNVSIINFNVTSTDGVGVSKCWGTINNGVTNFTMVGTGSNYNYTNSSVPDGGYVFRAYCNDTSNNINNSQSRVFGIDTAVPDTTPPLLTILSPTNTTYASSSIGFNIYSNENLSRCVFSFNNFATNYSMTINSSLTGANYTNSSMTDGGYTTSFWCNDTSGNINSSQSVVFGIDTSAPAVTLYYPIAGYNTSVNLIDFNCSVSSGSTLSNLTLYIWNSSGEYYSNTTTASGTSASSLWSVNLTNGDYNWNCLGYGTNGISSWNNTNLTLNVNSSASVITGFIVPGISFNNSAVNLSVTAFNSRLLSSCWAQIILPNTTNLNFTGLCNSNYSYNVSVVGRYNVTFFANDTNNNVINATDYFYVRVPQNISIRTFSSSSNNTNTTLEIIYPKTNETIYLSGNLSEHNATLAADNYSINFKFDSNRFQVKLNDVDLSIDYNKSFGVDNASVTGYLKTYGVYNEYDIGFTNAILKYYYDDLSLSSTAESNLGLYKCDNWSFAEQICNSTYYSITPNATQNLSGNYFEFNVTSFSGFSIKQLEYCGDGVCNNGESCSSCAGDCGSCTTTTSGGGGRSAVIPTTPILNNIDFSELNSGNLEMRMGDIRTFQFNHKIVHLLTLQNLTSDTVLLLIQSEPITLELGLLNARQIDLNGDGANDLEIKLVSIVLDKANLLLTKLDGAEKLNIGELEGTIGGSSLFNVNLEILPEFKSIMPGENVSAKIDILNVNDIDERSIITVNSFVRYGEKIISNNSRILSLADSNSFLESLYIPADARSGTYLFGVDVVYKDAIISKSAEFKVKSEFGIGASTIFNNIIASIKKGFAFSLNILRKIFKEIILLVIILIVIGLIVLLKRKIRYPKKISEKILHKKRVSNKRLYSNIEKEVGRI